MEDNPDFITILMTLHQEEGRSSRALVAIMHFRRDLDSYMIGKCSDALSPRAARALAESWAAAMKLEIR